jgi:pantetheine-phosphate adenylyltransferase
MKTIIGYNQIIMKKAIYAFSGDPITFGHIDIIERVLKVFDLLVVAIGSNPDKNYTFSLAERFEMAKESLRDYYKVEVVTFDGLLVDYAYENGINTIVKGVRNDTDYNYETNLHQLGESQKLGIDTFLLPAKQDKQHISSSAVKALQKEQGIILEYVPLYVKQRLEEKINGQYLIGVTGEIGVGKSYVSDKLVEIAEKDGIEASNIELDKISHKILDTYNEELYKKCREAITENFGSEIALADGFIDRRKLGEIVFNDSKKLEKLNSILHPAVLVRLRKEIIGKKGILFLNAALFAEASITKLCNNNIILVSAADKFQKINLTKRGLNEEQIKRRISSQFDTYKKRQMLINAIKQDNHGCVWEFENGENTSKDDYNDLFEEIKEYCGIKNIY